MKNTIAFLIAIFVVIPAFKASFLCLKMGILGWRYVNPGKIHYLCTEFIRAGNTGF